MGYYGAATSPPGDGLALEQHARQPGVGLGRQGEGQYGNGDQHADARRDYGAQGALLAAGDRRGSAEDEDEHWAVEKDCAYQEDPIVGVLEEPAVVAPR